MHLLSHPPRVTSPATGAASQVYAWSYEHLLFPTWQRIVHGRTIARTLGELESSQWYSSGRLEELQLERLKRILAHAGTCVPYYREVFAKLGFDPRGMTSRDDLRELPLLTREIIAERAADLVDPAHRATNIRKGTSGTSGVPLRFEYCNESESWRQALRLRGYRWAGYHLGLPTLHYWASPATAPSGFTAAKVMVDRGLRREVYVDAIPQDEPSLRSAIATLRHVRPHVIIGYTQATAQLAHFVLENGLRDWENIPVICGAEGVLPGDRSVIGSAFGPVFETYGSRETMLIAAECDAHDGMHLSEENLVVEIMGQAGQAGQPAAPGESGDVVVTDLHNFGMPFIRYVNGDAATMSVGARCSCGRGLRKLQSVDGRRCDTLRAPDGTAIPGLLFAAALASHGAIVRAFEVVQTPSRKVTLSIVKGSEWSESKFDEVVRRLRAQLYGLPLVVRFVESIPASASGKRRPIRVAQTEDEGAESATSN